MTISQSVTATLTETFQVTTTGAAPEVLGSQSPGTLSRGAVIGVAFGGGICLLLVVFGGVILFRRMRRQGSPAGQVPTFRSSQFVLNISDSKEPLSPGKVNRHVCDSPTNNATQTLKKGEAIQCYLLLRLPRSLLYASPLCPRPASGLLFRPP